MTALFLVMFMNQWEENRRHGPALTGLACSLGALLLFGAKAFILPAMALMILCLSLTRDRNISLKEKEEGRKP